MFSRKLLHYFLTALPAALLFLGPGTLSANQATNSAESEFEAFVRTNGGFPENFPRLLQKGLRFTNPGRGDGFAPEVRSIQIPDSRSSQRDRVNDQEPRRLGFFGNTFVAYSPLANSLEVISWNFQEGRSDFILVRDFGVRGQTPRIEVQPPGRNACLTCHQHGGPIFSRAPWSEVAFLGSSPNETSSRLRTTILRARQRAGLPAINNVPIPGEPPLIERNEQVPEFDMSVRQYNLQMQESRMCREGCGDNLECKKLLLLHAVEPNPSYSENNPVFVRINELLAQHWPTDGYAHISSVLPDRNPLRSRAKGGVVTFIEAPQVRDLVYSEGPVFSPLAEPATLQGMPGVRITHRLGFEGESPGNPAKPRPMAGAIPSLLVRHLIGIRTACFGLREEDEGLFRFISNSQMRNLIFSDRPEIRALFESWPPQREQIVAALQNGVQSIAAEATRVQRLIPLQSPSLPSRSMFIQYCSGCHGGETPSATRLPLDQITALKSYKNGRVLEHLLGVRRSVMPPLIPVDIPRPTDGERQEMINQLRY